MGKTTFDFSRQQANPRIEQVAATRFLAGCTPLLHGHAVLDVVLILTNWAGALDSGLDYRSGQKRKGGGLDEECGLGRIRK